ncbi:MAG: hypothetical protein WBF32_10695 [Candidatus Aminicenantaceae bacterium]
MKIRGFMVIILLVAVVVFFLYTLKSGGNKDIPEQIEAFSSTKQKLTETNLSSLQKEVLSYIVSNGTTPQRLDDIRFSPVLTTGKWDAWGNNIKYERLSDENFRLTSAGHDGAFGTKDDIIKEY